MPTFTYQATDPQGEIVTGVLEAPDRSVVVERLQKDNFFPISIEIEKKQRTLPISFSFKRSAMSQKELLNFTVQMATLLKSGLELDRCLTILHELVEKEKSREVILAIQEAVHAGETLSGAMAKQEGVFSSLYLNMVRAGEAGGFLEKVFERLAYYLEGRLKLIESVRSALIYPLVVAAAGIIAMGILTAYVIPKFATIFEDMGGELPGSTQFLLWISRSVIEQYPWIILSVILAFGAIKGYMASEKGGRQWDRLVLKLPLFGSLVQKIVVSQFTRTLGTLLQSGVPIIQSLGIVKDTISNSLVADMMEEATTAVKEGKRLSVQIKATGLFPPLAVHMMMVGEESGRLDEMMIRMAKIYDEEVETTIKRLITLMEPAMILIMGLMVAFVVVSMLSAIFSINDLPF